MAVSPQIPDVMSPEYGQNLLEVYQRLLEEEPVHYDESIDAWLVSRHEDIRTVFRHPEITSDNYEWQFEEVHGRTILQMYGREHSQNRRLLNPFLTGAGLDSFTPVLERTIAAALAPLIAREFERSARDLLFPIMERERAAVSSGRRGAARFDLLLEFSRLYPIAATREMLGIPHEHHDDIQRWYLVMGGNISNLDRQEDPIELGRQVRKEVAEYFLPLIQERRGQGGKDLISLLADAEVDGQRLADEDIRAFISLILIAGGETTDTGTANLFRHLMMHPAQMQAVYEDRSLILDAIAESLRLTPPVQMILRVPNVELELQGVKIPARANVACVLGAGNRDPRKFGRPNEFDIYRTDNSTDRAFRASADHLTFGDSRHFCAGAMLAKNEMTIATNMVFDQMTGPPRFPAGFAPEEHGVWFRGPHTLPIEFDLKPQAARVG
jgi:pulcherriminic acid synthase